MNEIDEDDLERFNLLKQIFQKPEIMIEIYYGEEGEEIHVYTRTPDDIPVFICVMCDKALGSGDDNAFELIKDFSSEAIEMGIRSWACRVLRAGIGHVILKIND